MVTFLNISNENTPDEYNIPPVEDALKCILYTFKNYYNLKIIILVKYYVS